jgi:hypothetical protein
VLSRQIRLGTATQTMRSKPQNESCLPPKITDVTSYLLPYCGVLALVSGSLVDAKTVRSQPEQPFKGLIDIHRGLSPMTSTEYESRRYYVRVL